MLRKHLDFLVERYDHFASLDARPDDLGDLFTVSWMRAEIPKVVEKGIGHLTQVSMIVCSMRVPLIARSESLVVGRVQGLGTGAAPECVSPREVRLSLAVHTTG